MSSHADCRASLLLPKETMEYKTNTKPTSVRSHLNADIMEEAGQRILLIRDNLTSMTATAIVKNQMIPELRNSIIPLAHSLKLSQTTTVRTDTHQSFCSLENDTTLKSAGITIEVGHPNKVNKNRVAEKAI